MTDLSNALFAIAQRPDLGQLLRSCLDHLSFSAEARFANARFDFLERFREARHSAGKNELDRCLTQTEELHQLAVRDDLFLGRFPPPRPRELQLMADVLGQIAILSDTRLEGGPDDDDIVSAVKHLRAGWELFTDASSGVFIQTRPEAG